MFCYKLLKGALAGLCCDALHVLNTSFGSNLHDCSRVLSLQFVDSECMVLWMIYEGGGDLMYCRHFMLNERHCPGLDGGFFITFEDLG